MLLDKLAATEGLSPLARGNGCGCNRDMRGHGLSPLARGNQI